MPDNAPRTAAQAYLAAIVADPRSKPALRLRAAEALLRNDDIIQSAGRAAREINDAELEAIAKGEGGTPPKRGPVAGVPRTGPIHASGDTPTAKKGVAVGADFLSGPTSYLQKENPTAIVGTASVPASSLPATRSTPRPQRGPKRGTPGPVLVPAATSGDDVDPLS